MERCLCCNARLKNAEVCTRCQADWHRVIGTEQAAQSWLTKAVQLWEKGAAEKSIQALVLALTLEKTQMAIVFRDFVVNKYAQDIVELLAEQHLMAAHKRFYTARQLLPYSEKLQQLRAFTDYLLVKHHEEFQKSSLWRCFEKA